MTSARVIFLTSFISLICIGEATAVTKFADGPCSSKSYTLCRLSSGELRTVVITPERIVTAKPAAAAKHGLPSMTKVKPSHVVAKTVLGKLATKSLSSGQHKRNPDAWKEYVNYFKSGGSFKMPADVHNVTDPRKANRLAKDLLGKAHPVLKIIAACESGMKHYNEKTGYVLQGRLTPKDVGLLQIKSSVHERVALEEGFNIYSITGNISYAQKLYVEEGTRPWNPSKKCWGPKIPPRMRLPLKNQV